MRPLKCIGLLVAVCLAGVSGEVGATVVAVGDHGTILVTHDGRVWQTSASGTTSALLSVGYGEGSWVAVGRAGALLSSPDGMAWTPLVSPTSQDLFSVHAAAGGWVAVGYKAIISSSDGSHWVPGVTVTASTAPVASLSGPAAPSGMLTAIGYQDGWLAAGEGGVASSDGLTWKPAAAPGFVYGMATDGVRWTAVGPGGSIYSSEGARAWHDVVSGVHRDLHSVKWAEGLWTAVGETGVLLTSPDGENWTAQSTGVGAGLRGLDWDGAKWWAAGSNGTILTSSDARHWSMSSSGVAETLTAISSDGTPFPEPPSPPASANASVTPESGGGTAATPPLRCTPGSLAVDATQTFELHAADGTPPYVWRAPDGGTASSPTWIDSLSVAGTYVFHLSDDASPPQTASCTVHVSEARPGQDAAVVQADECTACNETLVPAIATAGPSARFAGSSFAPDGVAAPPNFLLLALLISGLLVVAGASWRCRWPASSCGGVTKTPLSIPCAPTSMPSSGNRRASTSRKSADASAEGPASFITTSRVF